MLHRALLARHFFSNSAECFQNWGASVELLRSKHGLGPVNLVTHQKLAGNDITLRHSHKMRACSMIFGGQLTYKRDTNVIQIYIHEVYIIQEMTLSKRDQSDISLNMDGDSKARNRSQSGNYS
jgi:hypothetical protein